MNFGCINSRTGPKNVGAPGKLIIWRPLKSMLFKVFDIGQGSRNFLKACIQISEKFYRAWKPVFTDTVFPIISVTSSRQRAGGRGPVLLYGPD